MHNLNYREALACEEGDRTRLAAFGVGLSRGLLHIMLHARRRRLADLVDVLLAFTTSRFFVGEELCLRRSDVTVRWVIVLLLYSQMCPRVISLNCSLMTDLESSIESE